jgi:predicted RNase H-like HicB family nuclease
MPRARRVTYCAVVEKKPGGELQARFPGFPQLVSCGKDLDELLREAGRALRSRVDRLVREGKRIPSPTPDRTIKSDPANRNAVLIGISVALPSRGSPD